MAQSQTTDSPGERGSWHPLEHGVLGDAQTQTNGAEDPLAAGAAVALWLSGSTGGGFSARNISDKCPCPHPCLHPLPPLLSPQELKQSEGK